MARRIILSVALLVSCLTTWAQSSTAADKPKLVVGIIVDQMRFEYLYRYQKKFGQGGFNRIMNQGYTLKNAHYNYVPTYTGPGHASVYTGTTPSVHGIIGNDFYDKAERKMVNCVGDPKYKPVGNPEGNGDVSPARLLTTTITDELKLSTQKKAKVIGVSFKDRGAVLPAGHMGDAAYWYDSKSGKFISSTYYLTKLPDWVEKFNQKNLADKFLSQTWNTVLPIEQYTESGPDESPYEGRLKGKANSTFPYNLKELRKANGEFELLALTPFGNDYLTEMAKAALAGEALGTHAWTDFLTISYSSTDALGHTTGPNSIELEDMYIRLDKNMEDLLNTLDEKVGKDAYTVFISADHAVAEVPQYLRDNKVPAGYFNESNVKANLEAYLQKFFPGREMIENMSNGQIFLNQGAFGVDPRTSGVDLLIASELISKYFMATEGVANVFTEHVIRQGSYDEGGVKGMVVRGYHPKRSGDLAIILEPGWFESYRVQGSTHGSPYTYDTHVPVLFYGFGITKGATSIYHTITDIAPTLSVLLKIKFPNGCTGQPVSEALKGE
jgi:predicted AlkP superfamily pyrophosphatase or phosphodiesterase